MTRQYDKIALVVGAGAVENAWGPVIEVLSKIVGYRINADGANCFFARLVYLMRFYATGTFPEAHQKTQELVGYVDKIKIDISKSLLDAERRQEIKARREFREILEKFVFSEIHKSVLITTNWDTVIGNSIDELGESNHPRPGSAIECTHIHGSIRDPANLYLPSELVREPYRTKISDSEMGTIHGSIWRTIEESNKTILYGLSLDPLDAELTQTLAAGWSSANLEEILIVNPEHAKIAQRVKLLLDDRYSAKIIGFDPTNLRNGCSYQ
jgi:hypothetical protein